jgi:protein SCO1/2
MKTVALAILLLLAGCALAAAALDGRPELAPRIGRPVDLALPLVAEDGSRTDLATMADGRPALVLLGYHRCPNLCGVAQGALLDALTATGLAPATYAVVFASIDPHETAADAADARRRLAESAPSADLSAWHFVTASAESIASLEASVGITVGQRADSSLYVHPVAVSAITPDGRIARVFTGIDYAPRDLRLALVEASEGRLGTLGDQVLLLCSGFDPTTGRYTDVVLAGVRIGGLLALAGLAGAIGYLGVRGRRAP